MNLASARQRFQSACAKQRNMVLRSGRLPSWRTWSCASEYPFDHSDEVENPSRHVQRRTSLIVQWSERPLIQPRTITTKRHPDFRQHSFRTTRQQVRSNSRYKVKHGLFALRPESIVPQLCVWFSAIRRQRRTRNKGVTLQRADQDSRFGRLKLDTVPSRRS